MAIKSECLNKDIEIFMYLCEREQYSTKTNNNNNDLKYVNRGKKRREAQSQSSYKPVSKKL